MLNQIFQLAKAGSNVAKSLFIMAVGVLGVFLVLAVFYLLIRVLRKALAEKGKQG